MIFCFSSSGMCSASCRLRITYPRSGEGSRRIVLRCAVLPCVGVNVVCRRERRIENAARRRDSGQQLLIDFLFGLFVTIDRIERIARQPPDPLIVAAKIDRRVAAEYGSDDYLVERTLNPVAAGCADD